MERIRDVIGHVASRMGQNNDQMSIGGCRGPQPVCLGFDEGGQSVSAEFVFHLAQAWSHLPWAAEITLLVYIHHVLPCLHLKYNFIIHIYAFMWLQGVTCCTALSCVAVYQRTDTNLHLSVMQWPEQSVQLLDMISLVKKWVSVSHGPENHTDHVWAGVDE